MLYLLWLLQQQYCLSDSGAVVPLSMCRRVESGYKKLGTRTKWDGKATRNRNKKGLRKDEKSTTSIFLRTILKELITVSILGTDFSLSNCRK